MARHRLGYSPCPNDTFIFYAWAHGLTAPAMPVEPILHDVEELNRWALQGKLEFTKASVAAFLHASHNYVALRCGGALGKGVGPLLVARRPIQDLKTLRIASPGPLTTAHLLFQLCHGQQSQLIPYRYDQIVPAVTSGEVDAGIIIHESRFTYLQHGLQPITDLGQWWERETGRPLPLGLILARRDLDSHVIERAQSTIRQSILYARSHLREVFPYLKANAQELEDEVILSHVDLYVNDFTLEVGNEGEEAVRELFARAAQRGLIKPEQAIHSHLFLPADLDAEVGGLVKWT